MSIWKVALPVAGPDVYDYLAPDISPGHSEVMGCGVTVPFGRRRLKGVVVEVSADSEVPRNRLRRVEAIHDSVLDSPSLSLLQFAARHYRHPLGLALATALPGDLIGHAGVTRRHYGITDAGRQALTEGRVRGKSQREVLSMLAETRNARPRDELTASDAVLRTLCTKSWLQRIDKAESSIPHTQAGSPVMLRPDQEQCAATMTLDDGYGTTLLRGSTGSGKTEIYLERASRVIASGRQVLMLVPEIALTPHMTERVRARVSGRIAVLHSQRTDGERRAVWRAARRGEVDFVLATRSGIFLPLPRLGLLIVDEEHEASYKQQDGLRYSARDLAVYRGQLQQCRVILGSATPALESLRNAELGRYTLHRLSTPVKGRQDLQLVDLRPFPAADPISPPLQQLMRQHLAADGQVFLFLNRRGFAPVLYCAECQWIPQCPRCDSALVWHRSDKELRCHHCDTHQPVPGHCGECESTDLVPVGWGTQRVMDALEKLFPDVPALRFDRDSLRGKGSLEKALDAIDNNQTRIVVGTQMLAKGHDFPHLSLVAVLDADGGLFSSDFRATERLGQLLTQVRGRAGRRAQDACCVIQTRSPEHPHLQAWLSRGYGGLASTLLEERQETNWPPYSQLALLRAESPEESALTQFWNLLADHVQWPDEATEHLGPVSRPRRSGRYRSQMLLRAATRADLNRTLHVLNHTLGTANWARKVRWSLDIDPWSLD